MSAVTLKVTPQELKNKANAIQQQINSIEKNWNNICNTIAASKGYWQGSASDVHQRELKEFQDDMNRVIKRLKEHPGDLLEMAGVYESTEADLVAEASKLEADVIS